MYVQDLSSIQYAGGDEIFKEITIHESLIKIIQMSSLSEYQIGIYFPVSDAKLNISARESWQEKIKYFELLLAIYDLMNDYLRCFLVSSFASVQIKVKCP